jgi:hypothetical protein
MQNTFIYFIYKLNQGFVIVEFKIYGIPNNHIKYNNVLCRYSCVKIWIICGDIDRGWCDISDWGIYCWHNIFLSTNNEI